MKEISPWFVRGPDDRFDPDEVYGNSSNQLKNFGNCLGFVIFYF